MAGGDPRQKALSESEDGRALKDRWHVPGGDEEVDLLGGGCSGICS